MKNILKFWPDWGVQEYFHQEWNNEECFLSLFLICKWFWMVNNLDMSHNQKSQWSGICLQTKYKDAWVQCQLKEYISIQQAYFMLKQTKTSAWEKMLFDHVSQSLKQQL